jgi:hypothetical protein
MKKRQPGRPPRADGHVFPHDEVTRILLDGEMVPQPNGPPRREFPGPRALAERYGVSPSTICRFAQKLGIANGQRSLTEQATRSTVRVSIPWGKIERLLIEGEAFRRLDGRLVFVIPDWANVAARFGVPVSTLRHFAKERCCVERRNAIMSPVTEEDD